jgi:hypothetical protein
VYLGNVEKVTHSNSSYELRRYAGGALITTQYSASGTQTGSTIQYLLKDHLGSPDAAPPNDGCTARPQKITPTPARPG